MRFCEFMRPVSIFFPGDGPACYDARMQQMEQLGPYRLSRRLGRGGMGTVYEGLDVEAGQPAAIKVLNPHLAVEEGFRERFEIEIETLKKLKHPNIVRLYGFGEEHGVIFYAMELVHGTNLEDELQAGRRFNWRKTTGLGIKLARALQHAHDHGVIHRDLKPANLLLTTEGDLKLADFGIARLFGNTRLTSAGGLVGTAEYMAPEQADGRGITPQCDLYSLGGVLFAMLAGRPPFSGASLPEVLQMHRFTPPPPVANMRPTFRLNWAKSSAVCFPKSRQLAERTHGSSPSSLPRWSTPFRYLAPAPPRLRNSSCFLHPQARLRPRCRKRHRDEFRSRRSICRRSP